MEDWNPRKSLQQQKPCQVFPWSLQSLTLLNVLVELVNEGIQLFPLHHGEIQRVTGVHPLAQGAAEAKGHCYSPAVLSA